MRCPRFKGGLRNNLGVVVAFTFFFAGSVQAGWLSNPSGLASKFQQMKGGKAQSSSGYVSNKSAGTMDGRVQQAHEKHPEIAKKLDAVMEKLTAFHDEVKSTNCKTCNNLAGTLKNAKAEAYSIYRTLIGEQPYNRKGKVKSIFKHFSKSYDNRIKWRVPKGPKGDEWVKRWANIKAEFAALESDVLKVAQ